MDISKKLILVGLLVLGLLACSIKYASVTPKVINSNEVMALADFHSSKVQPIFNAKCVACHSCYNSPCQLNLTSYEGLSRGANKDNLYDFSMITDRQPTRLYVDANSEREWQKLGFFSVTNKSPHNLLEYLITTPPGIESGLQNEYDSEYSRSCIKSTEYSELKKFQKINPAGRMPLGLPGLTEEEIQSVTTWLEKGAIGPDLQKMEASVLIKLASPIRDWEKFLNGDSLKERITARYIYEHLFLATIYFEEYPNIPLRLIRSKTRVGNIEEIGTSFPFSPPPERFYYRLRPITNTIVHKTNIPFFLNQERLSSYKEIFLKQKWDEDPKVMPPYGHSGSNPFTTFKSMPRSARYQFFLDNAGYFIMTFIKGPVCRGQTALNVIDDHFWVFFMDPKYDPLVQSEETYLEVAKKTKFPADLEGTLHPLVDFKEKYWNSVEAKFNYLKNKKLSIEALWQGNKENTNANITVYRHFDSATVLRGLRGKPPKTVWVLDYHIFESIYYNLSAGYNVFAPLIHQVNSRLYMEVSRVAAEDLFLSFLPKDQRALLRNEWNKPVPRKKESFLKHLADAITEDVHEKLTKDYPYQGNLISAQDKAKTKQEFLRFLIENYFSTKQTKRKGFLKERGHIFSELNLLTSQTVRHLPDATLIIVNDDGKKSLWTMIHNKSHFNVAMMFFEGDRRNPDEDTVDVLEGVATSYANFIIPLDKSQVSSFIIELQSSKTKREVENTLFKFGLLRNNPKFWEVYNDVSRLSKTKETNEYGYLDLNRYINLFSK